MAQQTARRNYSNRPPKKVQPDSRTKFDVWLENHLSSGEIVQFVFKEAPLHVSVGKCMVKARILTVDRYTVYMEIEVNVGANQEDSHWVPVWVTKENIISAT